MDKYLFLSVLPRVRDNLYFIIVQNNNETFLNNTPFKPSGVKVGVLEYLVKLKYTIFLNRFYIEINSMSKAEKFYMNFKW